MTEYTPEKVSELVVETRERAKFLLALDEVEAHFDGRQQNVLADALIAVSAERDRLHKAITEALAERMSMGADRILRAALEN